MGSSVSVGQFSAKIHEAGRGMITASQVAVNETALAGKGIFLANMGARRMSGVGRRGSKLGARFKAAAQSTNPQALLYFTGQAHLLNNPTRPHEITPRSRRGRGAKALTTPNGPKARVQHPGTAGKQFYERSLPQVEAVASKILRRAVSTALKRSF